MICAIVPLRHQSMMMYAMTLHMDRCSTMFQYDFRLNGSMSRIPPLSHMSKLLLINRVWEYPWKINSPPGGFLAATKQLYDWFSPSVRPSVHPSVTPFSPCSHHRIIMKFSGVITMVRSDVHAKGQGQRSKVKVTEVNTQLNRFRTLTPVWVHIWQWNHEHSWKQHRRGALLFFKVIRQIARSHGSKNRRIWPRLGVSGL